MDDWNLFRLQTCYWSYKFLGLPSNLRILSLFFYILVVRCERIFHRPASGSTELKPCFFPWSLVPAATVHAHTLLWSCPSCHHARPVGVVVSGSISGSHSYTGWLTITYRQTWLQIYPIKPKVNPSPLHFHLAKNAKTPLQCHLVGNTMEERSWWKEQLDLQLEELSVANLKEVLTCDPASTLCHGP